MDYYYGRKSNYFWIRIASVLGLEKDYFFDITEGINRKLHVMTNRFCCLDVINAITFAGQNLDLVNSFIEDHVLSNFLDQTIWSRSIDKKQILLTRTYNQSILSTLRDTMSITKVIHTMGNRRIINQLKTKPQEHSLGLDGFKGFMQSIHDLCKDKGIEFVFDSLSPSGYAIRNGATKINDLDNWLINHLNLNK